MRYVCCIWLAIVWLVCHAQMRVSGLHIQKAPEIVQRITRQATRYGSATVGGGGGGSSAASGYRPAASQSSNYNVRNGPSDQASAIINHSIGGAQRTGGIGAYSFGGMASGRPTNGNSFAIKTASGGGKGIARPQVPLNQPLVGGSGGKPSQLQQALIQAAQYQLQQKQAYQQQQQYQPQHTLSQQSTLRRQVPQQGYRQRPAASSYEYQQFK